jgi:hypothetical protein
MSFTRVAWGVVWAFAVDEKGKPDMSSATAPNTMNLMNARFTLAHRFLR